MLVISCHADTGFRSHRLEHLKGGLLRGHLDNFAGVHAVMNAYFSGYLTGPHVRIELTYGEEVGCLGAIEVLPTLSPQDVVIVVDVTGTPTEHDFCIEKCRDPWLSHFLTDALAGMSYDLYEGCPDPVSDADEVDVYVQRCPRTFFLGVPVQGGDYNAGVVQCRRQSLDAISQAICKIASHYQKVSPS